MPERKPLFSVTIHDCRVDTFRSGGKGGQHQNKTESGVRVTHHPSGAVGESREERSQHLNKRNAFRRMAETDRFQLWAKRRASELQCGKTIEEKVDEQMSPEHLLVEVRDEQGRWAPDNHEAGQSIP